MENKIVEVGIFWVIPNKELGQQILELKKRCYVSEADSRGFVNYPYSHYEMWEEAVSGKGNDCYKYPRGRIIYDANNNRHKIYADKCVEQSVIERLLAMFSVEDYALCRDEHYVCPNCAESAKNSVPFLEYDILRGKNKIGENLIEISYGDAKILVELGKSLEGGDERFERKILREKFTAVIVSHYHEDHAGLIPFKHDCPVYIGRGAYRVLNAIANYRGQTMGDNIRTYLNAKPFYVGKNKSNAVFVRSLCI